jgi:hypothetical protein
LAGVLLTLAALTFAPISKRLTKAVRASNGCTDATLNGTYALLEPSGITGSRPHSRGVPWQFAGIETFDGSGNTSVSYTAAVNGIVYTNQTGAGTYTVNSDCTGSISLTSGDAGGVTANFALANAASEIYGIITNQGDTATFIEKKQ